MNRHLTSALCIGALLLAAQAVQAAQITFYEGEDFRGRAFTTNRPVGDFRNDGFNDRASSVVVDSGDWVVCDDVGYRGHCVLLRPGAYDSLHRLGVDNRISSVQRADRRRGDHMDEPAPLASADYEYRRRPNEPVDEARVTSVRAVVRDRDRHCWVEREQVEDRGGRNVGCNRRRRHHRRHHRPSDRPRDRSKGGDSGRRRRRCRRWRECRPRPETDDDVYDRDVRHCESRADSEPEYWDVTYEYRGVEHFVKMTAPPGRTILVNRNGEPRQ